MIQEGDLHFPTAVLSWLHKAVVSGNHTNAPKFDLA